MTLKVVSILIVQFSSRNSSLAPAKKFAIVWFWQQLHSLMSNLFLMVFTASACSHSFSLLLALWSNVHLSLFI